jgi:[protein-PII] uridylyltransferase
MLLSKIAGALAANSLNILRADFFLRADQLVLDIFRVCTTDFEPVRDEKQIKGVGELIARACMGEAIDFAALIAKRLKEEPEPLPGWRREFPMRVYMTNEQHRDYTVVEIQAVDRIGLLFQVFDTIGKFGLEITHARINTEKGAAIDSFCLTGQDGKKITDQALLQQLKTALEEACLIPA